MSLPGLPNVAQVEQVVTLRWSGQQIVQGLTGIFRGGLAAGLTGTMLYRIIYPLVN